MCFPRFENNSSFMKKMAYLAPRNKISFGVFLRFLFRTPALGIYPQVIVAGKPAGLTLKIPIYFHLIFPCIFSPVACRPASLRQPNSH